MFFFRGRNAPIFLPNVSFEREVVWIILTYYDFGYDLIIVDVRTNMLLTVHYNGRARQDKNIIYTGADPGGGGGSCWSGPPFWGHPNLIKREKSHANACKCTLDELILAFVCFNYKFGYM